MATLDDVSAYARELPEVVEQDRRGTRTWTVAGKTFAWERAFSKADIRRYGEETPPGGPILAVRVEDLHEKEAILSQPPAGFFTIPHFDGFAAVLVELDSVRPDDLRDVIVDGWLACAPSTLADRFLQR